MDAVLALLLLPTLALISFHFFSEKSWSYYLLFGAAGFVPFPLLLSDLSYMDYLISLVICMNFLILIYMSRLRLSRKLNITSTTIIVRIIMALSYLLPYIALSIFRLESISTQVTMEKLTPMDILSISLLLMLLYPLIHLLGRRER